MDNFTNDLFDEKRVRKALKQGKRKTLITVALTSLAVLIGLYAINFAVFSFSSQQAFKQWDAYVRLSTPNGYISDTVDTQGVLGGTSQYKVSKDLTVKSVVVEQKQYQFGVLPSLTISRGAGGSIPVSGDDWQSTYKENGMRDLMFFHPRVEYKKYKHDEDLITKMEENKVYEAAISFDAPYKQNELPLAELPAMTWLWIDTYSQSEVKEFQKEAKEHDWSSVFIGETEALGFSVNTVTSPTDRLDSDYKTFLDLLHESFYLGHTKAYQMLKDQRMEDVEILGVVVYGTKDELAHILSNPHITAVSVGSVVNDY